MKNDLRFALRMIAAHRWFSTAVIVTLALGIGINTTVFTLVNAVLFKPVPIPGGEYIVTVHNQNITKPEQQSDISYPDYLEYKNQNTTFTGLEAGSRGQAIISEPGNPPERFNAMRITPGLFTLLQSPPLLGRAFGPADGKAGAPAVVLIGYSIWQNRYGGATDVIGRSVRIDGSPATIVGVMPAGFKFPDTQDMWIALTPTPELESRATRRVTLFGLH
jgi:hypothetical protein